jgi:hypothetical protein
MIEATPIINTERRSSFRLAGSSRSPVLRKMFSRTVGDACSCELANGVLRYGRTQRAKAGPGLFEQDAVSVSPFLVIETDPCGHVSDATVSPALQARSQFDEPWQLSCFTTCKEAPPLAPCSPFGPASPLSPLSPFGPGGPGGPWSPLMPWGPGGPCSPFAPWGPG